jgi:hypothetical protein
MNLLTPLFAAPDAELIKLLTIVVFAVLMGAAKFLAKRQQKQPIRASEADEINEFLQHTAKTRKDEQVRPLRRAQLRPQVEKPVQVEVVGDAPVGGQINRQVERDLDTRAFTQRSTQLGSEVAQADKQIDEHLHQVFDHRVSKLEAVPGEAATAPVAIAPELTEQSLLDIPATFATGLTDLLADPDSVRQAIVMNEILHRPEERWA